MALPDLTNQYIQDTYQRLLQVSSSGDITDGTGSLFIPPNAISAAYATSASYEINYETSSSYAETASLALELDSEKRANVKGYVYIAHGTTLHPGVGTSALYLGTTNSGMDLVRLNDSSLVLGGVTQNYGWRIFGIKHGLQGSTYTTEIDNLIATGSIKVSGSIDINLQSGSAFTITENDVDQENRLIFEYDQGDPTLIIAGRSAESSLHLKYNLTGDGLKLTNQGLITRNISGVEYGLRLNSNAFQPETGNQLDLGYYNDRWKTLYLYTGNKISWGSTLNTDNVALVNLTGTNTLQVTGSSDISLDVKGDISASGAIISGSLLVDGTTRTLYTSASFVYSGSSVTQVTQSFESGKQQITNISYTGSVEDGNPLEISVTGSDNIKKLYTIEYSGSNITQILVT